MGDGRSCLPSRGNLPGNSNYGLAEEEGKVGRARAFAKRDPDFVSGIAHRTRTTRTRARARTTRSGDTQASRFDILSASPRLRYWTNNHVVNTMK